MADEQRPLISGAMPVLRKDDRYELTDRTGHSVGEVPLSTIVNLVRQGRLFRTDKVRKNGGPMQPLGELQEFEDLFRELLPEAFQVDGSALRPAPELSGEVDTLTVAELFARLYREKRTGRLFLCESDRHHEKVIVFRQGVAISAMSNLEEEWLGELLISQGLIDAQAFEEAVALRKQNGSRIGSALVYLEKLSPRELRRALSVQAMERLLNAFRMRSGTFQFVADESAGNEEILLVASPRDIIETGLSAALEAREVAEQLTSYGDPVFRVEVPPDFATELSEVDVQILRVLERGRPLSTCIETIAQLGRLTTAEARLRVLALMVFGVLHVGGAEVEALDKIVGSLQTMDYFRLLDVRRAASPDEITTAFRRKMVEYHGQPTPGDSAAVQRTRERIAATLERARATLSNPEVRPLYERALQLGLDYHQPEVRQRLEHEQLVAKGRALLAQQAYQEAFETFARAAGLMPDDARIFTQIGWARFLASDHGKEAAAEAIADVERALRVTGDQDEAYMTIGKIHRLSGDLAAAEDYLRRSIELNPHNNEAQSELRLLFTRELQRGGPKIKIDLSSAAGAGAVLGVAVVVLALLYVGANQVPGGAEVWPDVAAERVAAMESDEDNEMADLATQVNERLRGEYDPTVPDKQRVMGNVEFFYLANDAWWWIRRAALLVIGLLGVLLINKESFAKISIAGSKPGWIMAALPYGLLIGFLSPTPDTSTGIGLALGMTAFHVLAEQMFFFVFIGRGLLNALEDPRLAVAITALLFGLHQLTFFATLHTPTSFMLQGVAQVAAFAGGAYAVLLWRSGGILAPLIAHLLVNGMMMTRAVLMAG